MLELFAFGTIWFYLLSLITVILLFSALENNSSFFATLVLVVFAALLQFFGNFPLYETVTNNPVMFLIGVLVYFAGGAVWATVKWYLYCSDQREVYNKMKADFLSENGLKGNVIPEHRKEDWQRRVGYYTFPPLVTRSKEYIYNWVVFWPMSFIWTLINDSIKRIWKFIYVQLQEFWQGISNRMFKGIEDDLPSKGN